MNIWYVSKYGKIPSSGIPTRQFFLSKVFARLGANTTLISSRSDGLPHDSFSGLKKIEYHSNVRCAILNGPVINSGFNAKRIYSWLLFEMNFWIFGNLTKSDEYPDVIIASSMSLLTFFTAAILKRRFKCRLILEIRDIWPDSLVEMSGIRNNSLVIKTLRFVELFGYKRADAFVSTLPHFDNYLKTKICRPFKFKFIPQGFDNDYINIEKSDQFSQIFTKDKFTVCYSGTIGKFNNIGLVIDTAKRLQKSNIQFVIIGRGPLKKDMEAKSSDLKNIVFLDFIPKKFLLSVISMADLMIFPSKYFPIFQYGVSPNKWVDYMLAGRPIIDTHIPDSANFQCIIKDANCAFLLNTDSPEILAEKLKDIAKMSINELNIMGNNGKNYALKNLDFAILGKEYFEFVQEIIMN
jgi:glycosyltransferase involved in cell wall biosynthesis